MTGTVLILAIGLTSLAGCLALALSQPRNRRRVFGHGVAEAAPGWLRPSGWSLLGLSLLISLMSEGISFGAVIWPMALAASSLLAAAALAFIPERLEWIIPGHEGQKPKE